MPDVSVLTKAILKTIAAITGEFVGTTDTQTVSAKTLTTPIINGVKFADASKTANYTLAATDSTVRVDASAGAVTLTLPAASGNAGLTYTIIRTDLVSSTNKVTIDGNGTETIDGMTTYILWTGESLVIECDGTNWVTRVEPSPVGLGYSFLRGTTANVRYVAGVNANNALITSTTGPVVNTLYAVPFPLARTTKFDLVECEVTTLGAGSNVRLGIYRDNGNCYPGSLIFDSGNISSATTGAKSATITAALQIFQPGLYWLTYENSATVPQIRALPGGGTCWPTLGFATPFGTTLPGIAYTVAHTVGALPDPYTAGGTIRTTGSLVTNPVPAIGLRAV